MRRDQEIEAPRAEMSALRPVAETVTAPGLTQLQNDLKKLKDSLEPLQEDVRALKEWVRISTPPFTQQPTSPFAPPQSPTPTHTALFHIGGNRQNRMPLLKS
jgi:hypothetical protein